MHSILMVLACFSQPSLDLKVASETAVAVIEHQENLIKSWRIEYTTAIKSMSLGRDGQFGWQKSSYQEVRSGNRNRSKLRVETNGGKTGVSHTTENAFDGTKYRQFAPEENRGSVNSQSGVDFSYLAYIYGSTQPLSSALRSGALKMDCRWVNFGGGFLLECVLPEVNGAVRSLCLDPEHSWQPRRIVVDQTIPAGTYLDGRQKEIMVFDIKEFIKRESVDLPSIVEMTFDAIHEGDRRVRIQESRIQISSLEVNPVIPDSEFIIEFPEGATVVDRDRDVIYIQGQPNSERQLGSRSPTARPISPNGLLWVWWADWRVWMGFATLVGITLAVLYWKNHES